MTLEELNAKLDLEYEELVAKGLKWSIEHDENEHVYFVQHAYEFSHYNDIKDFFKNMNEKEYNKDWKDLIEANEGKDLLKGIHKVWSRYDEIKVDCHYYTNVKYIILNYLKSTYNPQKR